MNDASKPTIREVIEILCGDTGGTDHIGPWLSGSSKCTLCGSVSHTRFLWSECAKIPWKFECGQCGQMEAMFMVFNKDEGEVA